jgi:hypothetical protein
VTEEVLSDREQQAAEWCDELRGAMAALRGGFEYPPPDADPPVVHDALIDMRARLDLAETVVAESARRRRKARRVAKDLADRAADAYDTELEPLSRRAVRQQYESVKDREVLARVKASPAYRRAREAARMADLVEEADDEIRAAFFALRDIREDLLARLRFLPWLSNLEH